MSLGALEARTPALTRIDPQAVQGQSGAPVFTVRDVLTEMSAKPTLPRPSVADSWSYAWWVPPRRRHPKNDVEAVLRAAGARLALVEESLAGLEAARAQEHPVGVDGDEVEFWALEELKSRTVDGSAVLFTGAVRLPSKAYYEWQQTFDAEPLLEGDWTLAADVLAALGQPVRLTLLRQVLLGVETVSELGALEGLGTTGQLYHHLRSLVAAG